MVDPVLRFIVHRQAATNRKLDRVLDQLLEPDHAGPADQSPNAWMTTGEVAERLGRSPDWVRANAARLGGRQFGNGGNGDPFYFPRDRIEALARGEQVEEGAEPEQPKPAKLKRRRQQPNGELLPVKGRRAA